jgi:prevent-host-death family protein
MGTSTSASVVAKLAETANTEAAMPKVSATELKNRLGSYLAELGAEPLVVEKAGKAAAVVLSYAEYERLQAYEDHFWGERALAAAHEPALGVEESMDFLRRRFFEQDEDAAD